MLIVKKTEDNILLTTLEDIILQIPMYEIYKWKLLWLDGKSFKIDLSTLEHDINNSEIGFSVEGDKLLDFSRSFHQIIELLLIGDENEDKLYRYEEDDKMKEQCEFVIELVDSSYWEVTSKNKKFNQNLIKHLDAHQVQ